MIYTGVLLLQGNRTFGYHGKRLLYKFLPSTGNPLLVPYELKLGFSKDIKNKYVLVRKENDTIGILVETIGDVSDLSAFYEYRLYCRGVHDSISNFTKHVRQMSFITNDRPKPDTYVFSIDPAGCTDIDDAFSIYKTEHGVKLCVHIANVAWFLNTYGLWNYIRERISTVYLPDKRRTMLPPALSENRCGLLESTWRNVMTMELMIDNTGIIGEPVFRAEEVYINKNFAYEESKLLANHNYRTLLELTRQFGPKDSHDVVEHWMVYMNAKCGENLAKRKMGVFRTATILENADQQIIKDWNNAKCEYAAYADDKNLAHELLGKDAYAQITSPIRRLVDTINQQLFLYGSNDTVVIWLSRMDEINQRMKAIRKVQSECEIITKFYNEPSLMERTFAAVVFRVLENDNAIVYVSECRWFGKMKMATRLEEGTVLNVKMYVFSDEHNTNRKIQIAIG